MTRSINSFLFVSHTIGDFFLKNRPGITITSAPVSNRKLMILLQIFMVTFIFACFSNPSTPLTDLIFSSVIEPRKSSSLSSLSSNLFLQTFALFPIFEHCLLRTLIAGQSFLLSAGNFPHCMHFFSVLFLFGYLLSKFFIHCSFARQYQCLRK